MNSLSLDNKSLQILQVLERTPSASQRALASQSGFSLGLVNLIIKRLLQTGHIKVTNLNQKRVQYLLTRKGLVSKARHSYSYVAQTIRVYFEYKKRLGLLVADLLKQGKNRFVIIGRGELSDLLIEALQSHPGDHRYRLIEEGEPIDKGEFIIDCRYKSKFSADVGIVHLSEILSQPAGSLS